MMTDQPPINVATTLIGRRCTICGASDWLRHRQGAECSHCRLVIRASAALPDVPAEAERQLAAGGMTFPDLSAAGWFTDDAGARNLAWRFGHIVRPAGGGIIEPDGRPADMVAWRATATPHRVSLAMIARFDDHRADAAIAALAGAFDRRLVLLDAPTGSAHAGRFPGAIVACHPLDGDFAAQRNRLQAMAGDGWVLQIDSDEMPDRALLEALGWLTTAADRDGLRSLGLPRRNLVDGIQSALYPDIQYRLNRADVRFGNQVHERPIVPFAQTSLALVGALDHRLSAARVRERTRLYEGMCEGAGRPGDERLLLERYDPIAVR